MTRLLPTDASATTRRSTSRLWLFSALAIAEFSTFFTSCAMRFLREGELVDGRATPSCRGSAGGHQVELARADAHGAQHGLGLVVRLAAGCGWLAHRINPFETFLSPPCDREGAGRRELAELVADHLLGDVHRDELLAVVDAERQADELRQDRRAARPGLDHFVAARLPRAFSAFLSRIALDERALPNGTCHCLSSYRVA